ncbi:MAG: DUF4388 domain-containing protein [Deinococcota bacterium]
MRILLQGQLEQGILANLLQYLSLNQVSGVLQLRNARNRVGEIFFNSGQIVHIEVGNLQGVPALANLSSWASGGFNFRTQVAAPQHSVQLSLNNLLLEVSRYKQSQPFGDHDDTEDATITLDTVLTPVINNQNQGTVELRLQALHLFMQIDGARSLGDIAGRLGIPPNSVLEVAEELIDQDYVEFASSPAVSGDFVSGLSQLVTDFMESIDEETAQPVSEEPALVTAPATTSTTTQLGAESVLTLLPVVQNQGTVELRPETLDFLTQIDMGGPRRLADVAKDMGQHVADVVSLAEHLMAQGLVSVADSPTVSDDFIAELTRLFGNFMGPLARIFLEDAFESLDVEADKLPQSSLPDVLRILRGQLERNIQKTAFDRQVKRLCEKYGLGEQVDRYLQQSYAKNTQF